MSRSRRFSRRHAVTFYGTDDSLVITVAAFVREGLLAGEPALVIATPEHRDGIETRLQVGYIDVAERVRAGDLVMVDAEELMGTFIVGERPDPGAFERNVSAMLRQLQRGRQDGPVRAYGEIVNLLSEQGLTEAALEVERLWNGLASRYEFSLLCGYASDTVPAGAAARDICHLHTQVSHVTSGRIRPTIH